jgi:hypothetical protein
MINLSNIVYFSNKILLGFWGLTIADMIYFIDLDYLSFLSEDIRQIFALIGLIYFTIQLPFKVIKLNHKRKMDAVDLQTKINLQNHADKPKQKQDV